MYINNDHHEKLYLIIYACEQIYSALNEMPLITRRINDGELFCGYKLKRNGLICEFKTNKHELSEQISEFLSLLYVNKDFFVLTAENYEIILRIHIASPMAQMYAYLSPEHLKKIADMAFDLEISVFSEGKVLDTHFKRKNKKRRKREKSVKIRSRKRM